MTSDGVLAQLSRALPGRRDYEGLSRSWRGDVVAGVTVGVVALPLALAFGIASGVGAEAGLMTAIAAGVVAAVFGGSDVQVSGPTGAMTVVLVLVVAEHGAEAVLVVSLMAGVLVVAAGLMRMGRWLAYIPWPVIEGFTTGIAAIIFLQQVPAAVGVETPDGENSAVVALRAVFSGGLDPAAVALVGVVVVLMVGLPRLHAAVPASLVAVVAATLVAESVGPGSVRIGSLPASLPLPSLPPISPAQLGRLAGPALAVVAVLAALESLLSAKVADGMVAGRRPHDPDRELFGQGLANLVSPLFGGMPATGAIARTAVNIRSGARTRVASIVHSLVLVAAVVLAGGWISRIPLAALAGVLMVTAWRMVQRTRVRSVLRSTRSDAVVFVVTAAATVAFDLILAVQLGIAAAVVLSIRHMARTSQAEPVSGGETDVAGGTPDAVVVRSLEGALFFAAAQRLSEELTAIDAPVIVLRLSSLRVVDATGAQALGDALAEFGRRGTVVLLVGVRAEHVRILEASGALDRSTEEVRVFSNLADALEHGRERIAAPDPGARPSEPEGHERALSPRPG